MPTEILSKPGTIYASQPTKRSSQTEGVNSVPTHHHLGSEPSNQKMQHSDFLFYFFDFF